MQVVILQNRSCIASDSFQLRKSIAMQCCNHCCTSPTRKKVLAKITETRYNAGLGLEPVQDTDPALSKKAKKSKTAPPICPQEVLGEVHGNIAPDVAADESLDAAEATLKKRRKKQRLEASQPPEKKDLKLKVREDELRMGISDANHESKSRLKGSRIRQEKLHKQELSKASSSGAVVGEALQKGLLGTVLQAEQPLAAAWD